MESRLSPSFGHEKLENPSLSDLVDVVEDIWTHCVFDQAELVLQNPSGDIAAMTILSSYFEAIWEYRTGEPSDGQSRVYFVEGFCAVFRADEGAEAIRNAAGHVYKHLRCGVAHTGLPSRYVQYSRDVWKPLVLTFPKDASGNVDSTGELQSVVVNPRRMLDGLRRHFAYFIRDLRDGSDDVLRLGFERSIRRLWGVGEEPLIIGTTPEGLRGGA